MNNRSYCSTKNGANFVDSSDVESGLPDEVVSSASRAPQLPTQSQEVPPKPITVNVHWNESSYLAWHAYSDSDCEMNALGVPSVHDIAQLFNHIRDVVGFQYESAINCFELLMSQLCSRASRSDPRTALHSLHADYIGGPRANYRKWYFGAQMDLLDAEELAAAWEDAAAQEVTAESLADHCTPGSSIHGMKHFPGAKDQRDEFEKRYLAETRNPSLRESQLRWTESMMRCTDTERLIDLAIYLMCWGEANQIRFMPECLAFIVMCTRDYYYGPRLENSLHVKGNTFFLDNVITPLYECYRSYNFKQKNGIWVRKPYDHYRTIGYDDMNQMFWYRSGLDRIQIQGKSILDYPRADRFHYLGSVDWTKVFVKTFLETRSWMHILTNFSRIWIIHGSVFWFYTAANSSTLYTVNYDYLKDNQPAPHIKWTIVSLGGLIGPFLDAVSLAWEYRYVPRKFPGRKPIFLRLMFCTLLFLTIAAPAGYQLYATSWEVSTWHQLLIAYVMLSISILYAIYFSFKPLSSICGSGKTESREFLANKYFTADFRKLGHNSSLISWILGLLVFTAKFIESYFFLTLSVKDPIRELSIMKLKDVCVGDVYLGNKVCLLYPYLLLGGIIVTDMVLFFLDTYLWYVIFNTLISVILSYRSGSSVWTPWRRIYSWLPPRMEYKLLVVRTSEGLLTVWNSIVESLLIGHLITKTQAENMLYADSRSNNSQILQPAFFISEEDGTRSTSLIPDDCEAYRRISFFAQSMATPLPDPIPVNQMPSFSVLVPHYNEKILLSLSETVRQDSDGSKITILDYLQHLYPTEWKCFVEESRSFEDSATTSYGNDHQLINHDLPLRTIGFAKSSDECKNRTRIWSSRRTQTLYRTVSGFMNYFSALKVLYLAENNSIRQTYENPETNPKLWDELDSSVNSLVTSKFTMLVAMQKLMFFTEEQLADVNLLLTRFPGLNIAYVEQFENEMGMTEYYSSLIDNSCEIGSDGRRIPRIRVKLSGNPILGDGKSDNQNHALIFYRGEYIQLIDSNQDHYLEECLKIRNVLMEFNERILPENPYELNESGDSYLQNHNSPVAIVGAREYVFSENTGVLGDIAAGKEQTFGTLFARTLAKIGGKLHYGHPDFLNAVFMTTRGGVSKAQKGLHLNEDIYAGMTAVFRGGQIKHCEYMQCGKGRDLGFISILNFTAKIGTGMAEQILSRDYFYMGTQLPLDRFLSFFYAHPGFHLNNVFIMVCLNLFVFVLIWIATIGGSLTLCLYDRNLPTTTPHEPPGCTNVLPLLDWVRRCIISIFGISFISLLPLIVQELSEHGLGRALIRIGRHIISLSMFFEIFACRIYSQSFLQDLFVGGAKYISTGRGFAMTRIPFFQLYHMFATDSLYSGIRSLLALIYVSFMLWHPVLLWFWLTTLALCFSPFLYNPHQFARPQFFLDYQKLLKWFATAVVDPSFIKDSADKKSLTDQPPSEATGWITFVREERVKLVGKASRTPTDAARPSIFNILLSRVGASLCLTIVHIIPYVFLGSRQHTEKIGVPIANPLLRVACVAVLPLIINMAVTVILAIVSAVLAAFSCGLYARTQGNVCAFVAHFLSIIFHFTAYWVLYVLENESVGATLLGFLTATMIEKLIIDLMTVFALRRQRSSIQSNDAWWTGCWRHAKLGWGYFYIPLQEMLAKTCESSLFAADFMITHVFLASLGILLLVPKIDNAHTWLLLWVRPSKMPPRPTLPRKQERHKKRKVQKYFVVFMTMQLLLGALLVGPFVVPRFLFSYIVNIANTYVPGIVQTGIFTKNVSAGPTAKNPGE